ncbi:MAG TPA: tetratricopeptide repeat protein [Gammaproteobacteria bacterium]
MKPDSDQDERMIGEWRLHASAGGIEREGELRRLEPKVMDLLLLLTSRPGEAFSREAILAALWPGMVVGDDALPRCVSKLRRALDDEAQESRYIQTIPKRGYRLVARVERAAPPGNARPVQWRWPAAAMALVLAVVAIAVLWRGDAPGSRQAVVTSSAALIEQAEDYYARYTRADNESAIELYQRVLALEPDNARALSGLANALGQRALRWPDEESHAPPRHSTLTKALNEGRLALPNARLNLDAARAFAERSVEIAPASAASFKALGLVVSAQGDIDAAIAAYERALELDPQAWGAMINLAELYGYRGDAARSLALLERTYELQPHYAELGVLIGSIHEENGDVQEAMLRYRNVLGYAPFHREATLSLARLLANAGEAGEAARLCERLVERTGPFAACDAFTEGN